MRVVRRLVVLLVLLAAVGLAGCTGKELRSVERTSDDGEIFQFSVPEGTKQIRIRFSTEGRPASEGTASLIIAPQESGFSMTGYVYIKELRHGQSDDATVDVKPGTYQGVLDYEEYTGPAEVRVNAVGASIGPIQLGGSFWDIAGVVLAVLTAAGGYFLYRRHTSRLDREMQRIDETFKELRANVDDCRNELKDMQEDLSRQLVQGRLKESHYLILEKRIERYLAELDKVVPGQKGFSVRGRGESEVPLEFE